MALSGLAIAALSLVDAWIVHDREVRGEGYRDVLTTLSPWESVAVPVLTLGIVIGVATAAAALLQLRQRDGLPTWILPVASVLTLSLVASTLVPIGQDGHASSIDLTAGWAGLVGIALAATMVVTAVWLVRPRRTHVVRLVATGVIVLGVAVGARWIGLQVTAGSNEAWSDGSYTRAASDGQPAEVLTIGGDRFEIGDRWSGSWESLGWTIVLSEDPACPDIRGTYHLHGHPEALDEDLRFVMVVDPCRDGERGADLETGIWERN
jgi:hypothetical protein